MADLSLAFVTGMLGAGHCLAMCGGIAGAAFLAGRAGWRDHAAYHGGRILAYVGLATLAAGLGAALVMTGLIGRGQGLLYIGAGLVMVWVGVRTALARHVLPMGLRKTATLSRAAAHPSVGLWPIPRSARDRNCVASCALRAGPLEGEGLGERGGARDNPCRCHGAACMAPQAGYLAAGLANGLMPCALFFTIALQAMAAAHPLAGAGLGLAFGLGTVPAMLAAGVLAGWLGGSPWPRRLAGLGIALLGVETAWNGLKFFRVMLHLPLG